MVSPVWISDPTRSLETCCQRIFPSSPRALAQPPLGRHLVDRFLLLRALVVLGLTESLIEMATFLAALSFVGWKPGSRSAVVAYES